jgi:hypothetical protein
MLHVWQRRSKYQFHMSFGFIWPGLNATIHHTPGEHSNQYWCNCNHKSNVLIYVTFSVVNIPWKCQFYVQNQSTSHQLKLPSVLIIFPPTYWSNEYQTLIYDIIMKRKFKQWRSTIAPISTEQTIISHLNLLNMKKTMIYVSHWKWMSWIGTDTNKWQNETG